MEIPQQQRRGAPATLSFIASQSSPIETHSIWFGPDGLPARRELATPICLTFDCAGIRLEARAGRQDARAWLEVDADLGPLPYSAESRETRSAVIAVLIAAKLTGLSYFGVTPDQRVRLRGEIPLSIPLTPRAILTGATEFVMQVRPYLELLNEQLAELSAS